MQIFRSAIRRFRYVAVTFFVMMLLGIFVLNWHPQVAHASGPQVTVSNTAIMTTKSLVIKEGQTVAVTNAASVTAIIFSDRSGIVIANGQATPVIAAVTLADGNTTEYQITLPAAKTVTFQFTQPGVYHLLSANSGGGEETITVTA